VSYMATPIELLQAALVKIREHEQRFIALEKRVAELEQEVLGLKQGECFVGGTPT
jgi:hypothetical protein